MPNPRPRTTVWEAYNGLVKDLRNQGLSLQAIGDQVGVTRERIRQILNEHYGTTETASFTARSKLAKIIGSSTLSLIKLEQKGKVAPLHIGGFYLYNRDEAEKAVIALQRNCLHCGEPLPLRHRGKYCSKCKEDYRRNAYPFRSEKSRKKCQEAALSWQRRHPERKREICRYASAKFAAKKRKEHYATTQYVVVYGGIMPIGSIVKAMGCENGHLILENSLRIPLTHTRIIKNGTYQYYGQRTTVGKLRKKTG